MPPYSALLTPHLDPMCASGLRILARMQRSYGGTRGSNRDDEGLGRQIRVERLELGRFSWWKRCLIGDMAAACKSQKDCQRDEGKRLVSPAAKEDAKPWPEVAAELVYVGDQEMLLHCLRRETVGEMLGKEGESPSLGGGQGEGGRAPVEMI